MRSVIVLASSAFYTLNCFSSQMQNVTFEEIKHVGISLWRRESLDREIELDIYDGQTLFPAKSKCFLWFCEQGKNIIVFYGSQTGTAEEFANRLAKDAQRYGMKGMAADPEEYTMVILQQWDDLRAMILHQNEFLFLLNTRCIQCLLPRC